MARKECLMLCCTAIILVILLFVYHPLGTSLSLFIYFSMGKSSPHNRNEGALVLPWR
jgi:hypothetical protein